MFALVCFLHNSYYDHPSDTACILVVLLTLWFRVFMRYAMFHGEVIVLDMVTSWDVAMLCEPVLPSEPRANAVHVLPPSAEISAVRSVSRVVVPAPLV